MTVADRCLCGCGLVVAPGRWYRQGHNQRVAPNSASDRLSEPDELRRFARFRPGMWMVTQHDRFVDEWRAERVRVEVARAAGRSS